MLRLRSFVNSVFLGLWTAFMVSYAVTLSALRGDPEIFRRLQRAWATGLVRFWGVEVVVFGAELMRPDVSYVVMANHQSYADIVALFIALPTTPGFLAKRELMRIPFLAQALRSGGHVVIDRGRLSDAKQSIERAADQVRSGKTVLIFPEGTRGETPTIGDFKKGGFHLARAARVPILPVGVRGSGAVFPSDSIWVRPGRIEVHIGAELSAEEIATYDANETVSTVRAKIMELSAMPSREPVKPDVSGRRAPA